MTNPSHHTRVCHRSPEAGLVGQVYHAPPRSFPPSIHQSRSRVLRLAAARTWVNCLCALYRAATRWSALCATRRPLPNQQGSARSLRWSRISRDIFGAPGRGHACANLKACTMRHLHRHLQRRHRPWRPRRRSPALQPSHPPRRLRRPQPLTLRGMRRRARTEALLGAWSERVAPSPLPPQPTRGLEM